jgi:hypothetical protein
MTDQLADSVDILEEHPVRFLPPDGRDEWHPVQEWSEKDWEHWLLQHNEYPFLKHWTQEEVAQYVYKDRYTYGLGFGTTPNGPKTWFYNPTPVAVPFHRSKVPNILFGGAAGGSKSHSARWDAYRHCVAIPEYRCLIMRRTFAELKDNHLDAISTETTRMNDFLGREVFDFKRSDKEVWIDVHGRGRESKIIFGHCEHVGDEEKYLGSPYDGFYPDEMATFEKKQITGVQGRLRSAKWVNGQKLTARMAGTSNPGGAHTLWLKEYFIDKLTDKIREENKRYKPEKYQFLGAMLWDNPYYMDPDGTYTEYEDRLFQYDSERRRQLLMGDWSALAGQFFPEFTEHRHVATLDVPPNCRIERWIDWGYSPHYGMCLWVAVLPNGRLYVFYEYKFNGETAVKMVASEVAKKIRTYTMDEVLPLVRAKRISKSIADPSMWSGDGHSGEDYAQTFRNNGVMLIKGDNERPMGWGRLRHWFRNAPDGHPWLLIHPRCATLIRTIPGLIRDKNDPDDVDTTGEDHPADCLRYGVMARPSPTHFTASLPQILPYSVAEMLEAVKTGPQSRRMGMVN